MPERRVLGAPPGLATSLLLDGSLLQQPADSFVRLSVLLNPATFLFCVIGRRWGLV
jgi:hypothetical protein